MLNDLSKIEAFEFIFKTVKYVMESGIVMNNETVKQICKDYYGNVIYNKKMNLVLSKKNNLFNR